LWPRSSALALALLVPLASCGTGPRTSDFVREEAPLRLPGAFEAAVVVYRCGAGPTVAIWVDGKLEGGLLDASWWAACIPAGRHRVGLTTGFAAYLGGGAALHGSHFLSDLAGGETVLLNADSGLARVDLASGLAALEGLPRVRLQDPDGVEGRVESSASWLFVLVGIPLLGLLAVMAVAQVF